MAIVHRERANLPDGKALLYKEISNAYINTIDQFRKISLGDRLARFGWEIKENWIAYVAFRMQLNRSNRGKQSDETGLLATEADVLSWLSEAMRISHVENSEETARQFLEWVARRCGLLIPRGDEEYAFVHLGFQEYFCARFLAGRIMSRPFIKDTLPEDAAVTKVRLRKWAERVEWLESFVFLFEIISAENDIDWVQDLAEILFDDYARRDDALGDYGKLGAHLLSNKHVRLNREWREKLAKAISFEAFDEWLFSSGKSERETLKLLAETEFAAVFTDDEKKSNQISEGICHRSVQEFTTSCHLDDLYIVIARDKKISSIRNLAQATKLRYITLMNTSVKDISPLSKFRELRGVDFTNTPATDLEPLTCSREMLYLVLNGTKITDLNPLRNFGKLDLLELDRTSVSSLDGLRNLSNLNFLSISGTDVSDLSPLSNLSELTFLNVGETRIADLHPLRKTKLVRLDINGTDVENLTCLAEDALWHLSALNTKLKGLEQIEKFSNLERLQLSVGNSGDLTWLKSLKQLEYLELQGEGVKDLKFLVYLKKVKHLILTDTAVEDFSQIMKIKSIENLTVDGKIISNIGDFVSNQMNVE
jgi:hypothetical protein